MSDSESQAVMEQTEKKAKNGQIGRTDKQREATQKALAKLREKREKVNEILKSKSEEEHKKKVEEVDERIVTRIMAKLLEEDSVLAPAKTMKKPKKQIIVEESESDSEPEVVIVKKPKSKPKKKQIIVQQSESSEEEVPKKTSKKAKPKESVAPVSVPAPVERKTTGNKMLDKLYGYA